MEWQSAVMMSRQGLAVRATESGAIVRIDAGGVAVVLMESGMREAAASDWVGREDWQPVDTVEATGIPEKMRGRSGIEMVRAVRRRLNDNAGDEEDFVEIAQAYIYTLETLAAFSVVFWMNVGNEKFPKDVRQDAALKHAEAWLAEFAQYL